jgi:penicillin-binding protein 2
MISLQRAIQHSCNVYFYHVALKLGIEKLSYYGKMFGFGERTHIDIPHESRGIMPTIEWLTKRYQKRKWIPKGLIINYGIGQGEISVTPLQMAVYCATLANGGTIYQPHVVKATHNNILNRTTEFDYDSRKVNIKSKYFTLVRRGMYDVVNTPGGTANNAQIPGVKVAGKTGTAQNPHGRDHSWFISFAPYDNPKIALAVIVENAGFGSTVAAPIARKLIAEYLGVKLNVPKDSTNAVVQR